MYPEFNVGGFTRLDPVVAFFTRVNAIIPEGGDVLDFGAGRARWADPDVLAVHTTLRDLRRKAGRVVGVDVDPVVLSNPTLHEAHHIAPGQLLPFADDSFDTVVADFVFEHIEPADAGSTAAEFARIVRPGGWVAARTPNKWGMIGVVARLVPNALHSKVLRRLSPWRAEKDVFPTRYAMNTPRDLRRLFGPEDWNLYVCPHVSEPMYGGLSIWMWRLMATVDRLTPRRFQPVLMVFAERR
jgi:SAM-dependent methyltransferase